MRLIAPLILLAVGLPACKRPPAGAEAPPTVLETIEHLAADGEKLKAVSFALVVEGSTGKKLLPIIEDDPVADEIVAGIAEAIKKAIATLNQPDSPIRRLRRINEASRYFENAIMEHLNAAEDFLCETPPTAEGKAQRSGYPDLKIIHKKSGRITYLDPKLFEQGSRHSTLRTFYFEPKIETNKILDDAHHLLVGIEHDGNNGAWQFTNWHLVDLSKLTVRLKPEFQASNRDIYTDEGIILQPLKN